MTLEKMLISGVFNESRYNEVSFIDFSDFENKDYRYFWQLIKSHNGDVIKAISTLELAKRKDLALRVFDYSTLQSCNNLQKIALNIVELRFKRLLTDLLINLSNDTKNPLESNLLLECENGIHNHDIFNLMDGLLEYLGHQVNEYTVKRITDYLKYVDSRVEKIKSVCNGIK